MGGVGISVQGTTKATGLLDALLNSFAWSSALQARFTVTLKARDSIINF